jgi:hypothetical protein
MTAKQQIRLASIRRDLCAACVTPCARQNDAAAHADPCHACPLERPAFGPHDCLAAPLGDRIAAVIESRVLGPAERYAPRIVAAVRKCGGCAASKRALNREGDTEEQI